MYTHTTKDKQTIMNGTFVYGYFCNPRCRELSIMSWYKILGRLANNEIM